LLLIAGQPRCRPVYFLGSGGTGSPAKPSAAAMPRTSKPAACCASPLFVRCGPWQCEGLRASGRQLSLSARQRATSSYLGATCNANGRRERRVSTTLHQHGTSLLRVLVLDWPAGLARFLADEDPPVDRPADLWGLGSSCAGSEQALMAADRLALASSDRQVEVGSDAASAANESRRL
jgi:hypothetical protein